MNKTGIFRQ